MSDSSRDSPEVAGGAKDGPPGPEVHPGGSSTAHAGPSNPYEGSERWCESQKSMAGEDCTTSEVAALIPQPSPGERTGIDSALPQESGTAVVITPSCSQTASPPYSNVKEKGSGNQPVCQPPRPTGSRILPPKVRIGSTSSVCTKSSKKSQSSYKSAACQIQEVAGDDCCVHCILAFLFCEFLSLCSVMVGCLTCCGGEAGGGGGGCCCCPDGGCGDEDSCPCSTDCSVLGDCCESSDCLEICFECCSICFPG
ncbi:myoD family inhibitor-like isoform X2 [Ambystoma mexicanum]|uniref:myoD family inhibitor-like isoform X2 n=1 Tax=Ambystoma mexicanum TaxID=8296 RepID=UPI0037E98A5C